MYICFASYTYTRLERTEVPRDRNPKYIVLCYSRQHRPAHLQRTAIKCLDIQRHNRLFSVCQVQPRRELRVRWQSIGHKDEEAVLCANCVTSYPLPRSTRRTGVFIDFRASDASSAYSASRRETGEASFVLRVEITKAMHAVR
jgi:hypothetical protein